MKIMAVCGSGLGSSFMVEMNIKKVLKKSATVPADKLIVLDSIISMPELEEKLTDYFKK